MHPTETLRLDLVAARAELRTARQDLARKKRAVARGLVLHARTAKEREQEQDALVHEHPDVMALEDLVLRLHHREELIDAQLSNALRPQREYEWFVRESMSDSQNNLATAFTTRPKTCPCTQMAHAIATSTDDDGAFSGESDYIRQRALR